MCARGRAGAVRAAPARHRGAGGARGPAHRRIATGHQPAPARTVQPLSRSRWPSACGREAGPGRSQDLLSPHRARPGGRAHADRGGGARADAARRLPLRRPARGRAADRADRHRRAGVGARRRVPGRPARHPLKRRGRAPPGHPGGAAGAAGRRRLAWRPTPRTDGRPTRPSSARGTRRKARPPGWRCSPSRLPACPTCTWRRRCGRAARRSSSRGSHVAERANRPMRFRRADRRGFLRSVTGVGSGGHR